MVSFILLIPLAIIGGFFGGHYIFKRYGEQILNKSLLNRASAVIHGKVKNEYELDGKKQPVNVFINRDEKDVETKITLTK